MLENAHVVAQWSSNDVTAGQLTVVEYCLQTQKRVSLDISSVFLCCEIARKIQSNCVFNDVQGARYVLPKDVVVF